MPFLLPSQQRQSTEGIGEKTMKKERRGREPCRTLSSPKLGATAKPVVPCKWQKWVGNALSILPITPEASVFIQWAVDAQQFQ